VVYRGKTPGVYETWNECCKQTVGYTGNWFESFPTKEEAEEEFLKSLREEESNFEVGKQTAPAPDCRCRVKNYIILFQFIVIVFLFFYAR